MENLMYVIVITFIVMFIYSWLQKGNTIKDAFGSGVGCNIYIIATALLLFTIFYELKSCASKGPADDSYYDIHY